MALQRLYLDGNLAEQSEESFAHSVESVLVLIIHLRLLQLDAHRSLLVLLLLMMLLLLLLVLLLIVVMMLLLLVG